MTDLRVNYSTKHSVLEFRATFTTLFCLILTALNLIASAYAQGPPAPITASGLNTQISAPIAVGGKTQYDITGGTRAGPNLFHSFGQFGVPTNNIANFLNETPAIQTSNILGRVTGGNISNIFGAIQTTGFGNANLFLMNPAGFLFGPNATVNVGGMVAFTSADYLKLADNARFNAIPNTAADALLTASPVAAFGFLGSNPGAITVQGTQFTVTEGTGISLVGGNITIQSETLADGTVQPAKLTARGSQINLASVASSGEISAVDFLPTPGMTMGTINLSQGALLDVSADAAGTIRIRGGQLVISDATLSANTVNTNGAQVAIDINVAGDMSISDSRGVPAITASTSGTGDAGEVRVASRNLTATSSFVDPSGLPSTLIDTHSSDTGRAGNVNITTGTLQASSLTDTTAFYFIDSGTTGPGHGGDVTVTADSIQLNGTSISTGEFVGTQFGLYATGSAGNLTMTADTLQLRHTVLITDAFQGLVDTQQAGDITLNAREITTGNSQTQLQTNISSFGFGRGGAISINADSLVTDITLFQSNTVSGPGGGITLNARIVELANGSSLISNTLGDGRAGDIRVTASDHISLLGVTGANPQGIFRPSGLFSNSTGDLGSGNAGSIMVTTPRLEMNQGRINTSTASSGQGGNVSINAGSVSMAGEFPNPDFVPEPIFTITDIHPSGIFTKTVGGACSGPCGDAGQISITTGSLTMGNGSQIDSGTSSTGRGGVITIQASGPVSLSGTLSNGLPVGVFSRAIGTTPDSGAGGNIALAAGQSVTISNGAAVSASTIGAGNAGNIQINTPALEVTNGGQITSSSVIGPLSEIPSGSAGNVTVQGLASPADSVVISGFDENFNPSGIFTDTQGTGAGGNIFVNANTVTLQNGGTLSATTSGSGNAGNISVLGDQVSLTNLSAITTSTSGDGAGGTIDISAGDSISLLDSFISASANSLGPGAGSGGQITLRAPMIDVAGGDISTLTLGPGNAGDIQIQASTFRLGASENAFGVVEATTSGPGRGGNISVLGATGPGSLANDVLISDFGSLRSETLGNGGTAGNIAVEAVRLTMTGGSAITTSSHLNSSGNAGNVTVNATESVLVSGSFITSDVLEGSTGNGGQITITTPNLTVNSSPNFFGDIVPGLISTSTGSSGNAGSVTVNANHVTLTDGGRIASNSFLDDPIYPPATGAAGTVTIQGLASPAQSVLIDGTGSGIFTDTQGTGAGGNIFVNANTVTLQNSGTLSAATSGAEPSATGGTITVNANQAQLSNGGLITASTTGVGAGGSITIGAGSTFASNASTVSSTAAQAQGGDVTITAGQSVTLNNGSSISASSAGAGNAGNILINAGQNYTSTEQRGDHASSASERRQYHGAGYRYGSAHQQPTQRLGAGGPRRRWRQHHHRPEPGHSAEQPDHRQRGARQRREYLAHDQFSHCQQHFDRPDNSGPCQCDLRILTIRPERDHHHSVAERPSQRQDHSASRGNRRCSRRRCSTNAARRWPAASSAASPWRDETACQPNRASWLASPLAGAEQLMPGPRCEARGERA